MQSLTPLEYLYVDIANAFGLDRKTWDERISWTTSRINFLEDKEEDAKSPLLFAKAVYALRDVQKGRKTNHIMGLDATASGPQMMSCMSGCIESAKVVNLVDTKERRDIYSEIVDEMNENAKSLEQYERSELKKPIVSYFYGSTAQPENIFGPSVKTFYESMEKRMPGCVALMRLFQSHWDNYATEYNWVMPDGHHVHVPVKGILEQAFPVPFNPSSEFTFRTTVKKPNKNGRALAANIVHSVDAYVCRLMVKKAHQQGFQLATIHDNFYSSPKYMQQVRENYRDILINISKMNLVADILSQVSGRIVRYKKLSQNLHEKLPTMEYALS